MIWQRLRGTPFTSERLHPAMFIHFGTSREYWETVAADAALQRICGWVPHAAAWSSSGHCRPRLINAAVENASHLIDSDQHALIVDSCLRGIVILARCGDRRQRRYGPTDRVGAGRCSRSTAAGARLCHAHLRLVRRSQARLGFARRDFHESTLVRLANGGSASIRNCCGPTCLPPRAPCGMHASIRSPQIATIVWH